MHLKMTQTCRWSMFHMANTAIMPDFYIKNYNSILMTTFDVKTTRLISYQNITQTFCNPFSVRILVSMLVETKGNMFLNI